MIEELSALQPHWLDFATFLNFYIKPKIIKNYVKFIPLYTTV